VGVVLANGRGCAERVILKKKKEFKDMNAQENLEKLN